MGSQLLLGVMKYMRKKPNVPKGMNGVFFLSSRKGGGIGSKYAKSLIDFYRKNPQCLDITVCDPYIGHMKFRQSIVNRSFIYF